MTNVFDEKVNLNLNFILQDNLDVDSIEISQYENTVVIAYLYYIEDLNYYFKWLDQIDDRINLVIISSCEECLVKVREHFVNRKNFTSIQKPNVGRDISALLIAAKPIIEKYEYICFLHDKREHNEKVKLETRVWVENLWGNLINNTGYINQVISLLENRKDIGVLIPPMPIGKNFDTWFGFGWYQSYPATKELSQTLGLKCDIREDKPPITIGTALWFRREALVKLFSHSWKYEDFDDSKLIDSNYVSYAVERIFAYVAQDAGYKTAEIMNIEYAQYQTNYIQYASSMLLAEANKFFPISNISTLEQFREEERRLISFASNYNDIYIYGAGNMGRFVNTLLRRKGIRVNAFLDSDPVKNGEIVDLLEVKNIQDIACENCAVICAVANEKAQKVIEEILIEQKALGVYIFMKCDENF